MTDELVAYLLDDLCPQRRAEVEQRLETDAAWRREFERLRECFEASGNDPSPCCGSSANGPAGDFTEPPRDLVKKTCCFVEESGVHPKLASTRAVALTAAPASDCSRGSWSFADFAVGGGVMLALGMLMMPALRESRDASRGVACQNNLMGLGTALFDFQESHGHELPTVPPGTGAGIYAMQLVDSGVVSRARLAQMRMCPDSDFAARVAAGEASYNVPTPEEMRTAPNEQVKRLVVWLGGSYAFIIGYRDGAGEYHQFRYTADSHIPMMADAPRVVALGVRSANHGGGGQYVLYQDLHACYMANSDLAARRDNIFLNLDGEHAAGCDKSDVVLGTSQFGPDGPVEKLQLINVSKAEEQSLAPAAQED